jgi:hypothetical protein
MGMMIIFSRVTSAQNCLGLKNIDILNIAKQIDPLTIANVTVRGNKITSASGFKFVQLRDTETFILVPEDYQGRFIDFQELAASADQSRFVLDSDRLTAKLICQSGNEPKRKCKQERISRTEVGCAHCPAVKWLSASVLSDVAIIIPPYRQKN